MSPQGNMISSSMDGISRGVMEIIKKLLEQISPYGENGIFLFTIDHLQNKYWLNSEFYFEKSLQSLPLRLQIPIKTKKRLDDRCLVLGSKFLELFAIWIILAQNLQDYSDFTLDDILAGLQFNSNGKPLFNSEKIKSRFKFKNKNFTFNFNSSNDKESYINSMVIITSKISESALTIGLDLINIHLLNNSFITELKEGVLHKEELESLKYYAHNEEKYKRFFAQIWSLKESYSKYKGTGLVGLDLTTLNFKHVKLIEYPDTENSNIELFINDERQCGLTLVTRLLNKETYYSIIFDKIGNHKLKEIPLNLKDVDIVIQTISSR